MPIIYIHAENLYSSYLREKMEEKKEDNKEDNKEERVKGFVEVIKTLSDQQDALREIAVNKDVPESKQRSFDEEKTEGELFYHNAFGMKTDFTEIKVPPKPAIEGNLVLLTLEKWMNLEKIIANNKTDCIIRVNPAIHFEIIGAPYQTNRAYMIWARNDLRPDLRIMNQRNTAGKRIMTVEERALLGIKRFMHTIDGHRYHDVEMPTLTSSYVEIRKELRAIVVRFQNGGMYIDYQDRNIPGGAREVFGLE